MQNRCKKLMNILVDYLNFLSLSIEYFYKRSSAKFYKSRMHKRVQSAADNLFYINGKMWLFIHIPKTAGNSINELLRRNSSNEAPVAFEASRRKLRPFTKHLMFCEYKEILGRDFFDNCNIIAIYRDPIESKISSYYWWTQVAWKISSKLCLESILIRRQGLNSFLTTPRGRSCMNEFFGEPADWLEGADLSHYYHIDNLAQLVSDLELKSDDIKALNVTTRPRNWSDLDDFLVANLKTEMVRSYRLGFSSAKHREDLDTK